MRAGRSNLPRNCGGGRGGSREPVGILTHHLVHDETAWVFLEGLFDGYGRDSGLPLGIDPAICS